jgi:hypothetical protein
MMVIRPSSSRAPLRATLATAGEDVEISSELPWVSELVIEGTSGDLRPVGPDPTMFVRIESSRTAFDVRGWEPVAREAWGLAGRAVLHNVASSGFDMHLDASGAIPALTFRWRPAPRDRVLARILRSRFHLLARAVLLQYPALWWAGTGGRAPIHACAYEMQGRAPLIAGPSGAGKSTLVLAEIGAGARATSDNLCVGDGATVWGLAEPLRHDAGTGRRMPHGRREAAFEHRIPCVSVDRLMLLRRSTGPGAVLPCEPRSAARHLTTTTYAAGELRRYWPYAAVLAQATGIGPAHPPVERVAAIFADRLPCSIVELPQAASRDLPKHAEELFTQEARSWT